MDKKIPIRVLPQWDGQRGASLISILVALGVGGILMLGAGGLMRQMVYHASEIDLETELSRFRTDIATGIDCKGTLDHARAQLGVADNKTLCNATRISTTQIEGYDLSGANPIQLKFRSRKGYGRDMMGAVNTTQKSASIGGGWLAQVGCDWNAKTLVVKVKRKKANLEGQVKGGSLLFGDVGLAPTLCRDELTGAPPPPPPLSPREQMSEVRYTNTKSSDSQNKNYFDFEVDPRFKMVELRIQGEWEGNDDAGADVYSEQVFIDLVNSRYSGAQMVKISSDYKKARVAIWRDTSFLPSAGGSNPTPLEQCNQQKQGSGIILNGFCKAIIKICALCPPRFPNCQSMCGSSNNSNAGTAPAPYLQVFTDSVCNQMTSNAGWWKTRCVPDIKWESEKFPQPYLLCLEQNGSGRCVKFRYQARLLAGDDNGMHWWAMSVVIRKFN